MSATFFFLYMNGISLGSRKNADNEEFGLRTD